MIRAQEILATTAFSLWHPSGDPARSVTGCFACFARGRTGRGARGDRGWAAAVWLLDGRVAGEGIVQREALGAYEAGLLALREGPLLEAAVLALPERPDVLLVNATGRDHPRRAGLALHLGAAVSLPTIGVTNRPLVAEGSPPADLTGATSPLRIGTEIVGYWVRTRPRAAPLAVHAAWRTDPDTAVAVVTALIRRWRTPEPLRLARRAARQARATAPTG